jgi:transcriptional regulator with XRE-family HTH domain
MSVETPTAGAVILEARRRAGLSQAELGRRARVTQSVVSAYESGARQPSLPMLTRLVEAAGLRLSLRVQRPVSPPRPLSGGSRSRQDLGSRIPRVSALPPARWPKESP